MGTRLANAPVYFTILQVRFNSLLNLNDFLPNIQGAFRLEKYTDYKLSQNIVLELNPQDGLNNSNAPVPKMHESHFFGNAEKTYTFILDSGSLTLQSTDYGDFERFSGEFYKGLAIINDIVNLAFTDRIGLRYLDRVMPLGGEQLDLYLIPEVRGLNGNLGGSRQYLYNEALTEVNNVKLMSRVLIQNGPLTFPPDINVMDMAVQPKFINFEGENAILDNDGFVEAREEFSIENVKHHVEKIKVVVKKAFHAVATEYAFEVWER